MGQIGQEIHELRLNIQTPTDLIHIAYKQATGSLTRDETVKDDMKFFKYDVSQVKLSISVMKIVFLGVMAFLKIDRIKKEIVGKPVYSRL